MSRPFVESCPRCGAAFKAEDWRALSVVGMSRVKSSDGTPEVHETRRCPCGALIAHPLLVEVEPNTFATHAEAIDG